MEFGGKVVSRIHVSYLSKFVDNGVVLDHWASMVVRMGV